MKIPRSHWGTIAAAVAAEGWGSMTVLAEEYGVTRERIRQICAAYGVTGQGILATERAAHQAKLEGAALLALNLLPQRPMLTVPDLAEQFGLAAAELHKAMRAYDPEAWERWAKPSASRVRTWWGARCRKCGEWKTWTAMSRAANRAGGYATRCKACVAAKTQAIQAARDVSVPTVAEKWCNRCQQTRPAADFARNRRSRVGLQGYCRECRRAMTRKEPSQ